MLTVLICLLPYYHTGLGVMALVPFLFVSASNISKIWFVRAMGETEYLELLLKIAAKSKLSNALLCVFMSCFFVALSGFTLLILCYDTQNWGYWFAIGIIWYAFVIAIYGTFYYRRLYKKVQESAQMEENINITAQ